MHCECTACDQRFSGLADFDAHRPGPPGKQRPCLSQSQMRAQGWVETGGGLWHRPGFADRQEKFRLRFQRQGDAVCPR